MMEKYDGWVFKNKWGSLLIRTFGRTQREVKRRVTYWEEWEKIGFTIVKVKFVEVK